MDLVGKSRGQKIACSVDIPTWNPRCLFDNRSLICKELSHRVKKESTSVKVKKELLNEKNGDDLAATRQRKDHCQRSDSLAQHI
ncbi:hypothetical protein ACTXT7_005184 [Hymenolepis weldensis]